MTSNRPTLKPPIPPALAEFVKGAPGGAEAMAEPKAQTDAPKPEEGARTALDAASIRSLMPKAEPTKQIAVRVPLSLYEDMKFLARMGDATMTDIMIESAQREVERRLAKFNKR